MDDVFGALKKTGLFDGLPEEVMLREVLPHGQLQAYGKGQHLIQSQQVVNRFGVILSGRVNIMHIFPDGRHGLGVAEELPHVHKWVRLFKEWLEYVKFIEA